MAADPSSYNLAPYALMAGVEGADFTDSRNDTGADTFSHAPGRICKNCDRRIEARQPARRKGADGWVHDVCPPDPLAF